MKKRKGRTACRIVKDTSRGDQERERERLGERGMQTREAVKVDGGMKGRGRDAITEAGCSLLQLLSIRSPPRPHPPRHMTRPPVWGGTASVSSTAAVNAPR